MARQDRFDRIEQIQRGELLVGDAGGPVGFQAEMLAVLEAESYRC